MAVVSVSTPVTEGLTASGTLNGSWSGAALVPGNLLVAAVAIAGSAASTVIPTPANWTKFNNATDITQGTTNRLAFFYKTCTTTSTTSDRWSGTVTMTSGSAAVMQWQLSGADVVNPFAYWDSTTGSTGSLTNAMGNFGPDVGGMLLSAHCVEKATAATASYTASGTTGGTNAITSTVYPTTTTSSRGHVAFSQVTTLSQGVQVSPVGSFSGTNTVQLFTSIMVRPKPTFPAWMLNMTQVNDMRSASGATTRAITIPATTAGSSLLVQVAGGYNDASVSSITGGGGSWVDLASMNDANDVTSCWLNNSVTTGTTSLTLTLSAADFPVVNVYELTGGPFTLSSSSTASSTTGTTWSGTSLTSLPSASYDAMGLGVIWENSNQPYTATTASGWTGLPQVYGFGGTLVSAYQSGTLSGTVGWSGTNTPTSVGKQFYILALSTGPVEVDNTITVSSPGTVAVAAGTATLTISANNTVAAGPSSVAVAAGTASVSVASNNTITAGPATAAVAAGTASLTIVSNNTLTAGPASVSVVAGTASVTGTAEVSAGPASVNAVAGTVTVSAGQSTTITAGPASAAVAAGTVTLAIISNNTLTAGPASVSAVAGTASVAVASDNTVTIPSGGSVSALAGSVSLSATTTLAAGPASVSVAASGVQVASGTGLSAGPASVNAVAGTASLAIISNNTITAGPASVSVVAGSVAVSTGAGNTILAGPASVSAAAGTATIAIVQNGAVSAGPASVNAVAGTATLSASSSIAATSSSVTILTGTVTVGSMANTTITAGPASAVVHAGTCALAISSVISVTAAAVSAQASSATVTGTGNIVPGLVRLTRMAAQARLAQASSATVTGRRTGEVTITLEELP